MTRAFMVLASFALVLATVVGAAPSPVQAGGALKAVEEEFRAAIQRVTPATVVVVPTGVRGDAAGFSSGVVVSSDGLVLSDGDAGLVWRKEGDEVVKSWRTRVDVRLPQPKTGKFLVYPGRVLRRDASVDTSVIKIDRVPTGGFPFVPPGRSADLRVGDFAFVVGSSSFTNGGTIPTLTAGVVAAFDPLASGGSAGPHEFLYVSAAINEGVNGGPLVDLEGRLVGTVSTYLEAGPTQRYQFLGKAVPIDRIRAAMSGVPEARALFRAQPPDTPSSIGHTLEQVFHDAVVRAGPSVVSMTIDRKRPLSGRAPMGDETLEVPRYAGPVSGVVVSNDGLVATSLYNVANPGQLVDPLWRPTPEDELATGIADIEGATIHYPSGMDAPAVFVGHDPRTGVALFRARLDTRSNGVTVPQVAPASALERGRFVLALGNPYGKRRRPDPLLTLGILSKRHAKTAPVAWRDQWQTDAAGLDTNVGGAAVDVEGRVFGMMQLWHPGRHGRASGIAFVVPWSRVEMSVADILANRVPGPAFLGVQFGQSLEPVLRSVEDGHAAKAAGLEPGDRLIAIDGEAVPTMVEAITAIRMRYESETVRIRFERDGDVYEYDVVLGRRPD